mgnify:CR=1 FL=1
MNIVDLIASCIGIVLGHLLVQQPSKVYTDAISNMMPFSTYILYMVAEDLIKHNLQHAPTSMVRSINNYLKIYGNLCIVILPICR